MKFKLIVAAIIAGLIAFAVYSFDRASRLNKQLETSQAKAKYWQDKQGRSNAEIEVLRVENMKLSSLADSLKGVDIKPRTVTRVETVVVHHTDTVKIIKGKPFGDRWATFNINGDWLGYSFVDSLALITHTKRVGLFNKAYVTRVVSFNPYSRITGITSTEILPKTRRISIGMYAGYGLQFGRDGIVRYGWSTGVGVNFRVF